MEGYFTNGGVFQGMRAVTTGCPLPSGHAAGTQRPRRAGGVSNLFAFDNDLDHHRDGRQEWGNPDQWTASTTLAHEDSGPF